MRIPGEDVPHLPDAGIDANEIFDTLFELEKILFGRVAHLLTFLGISVNWDIMIYCGSLRCDEHSSQSGNFARLATSDPNLDIKKDMGLSPCTTATMLSATQPYNITVAASNTQT